VRRLLSATGAGVLAFGLLAWCSSGGDAAGNVKVNKDKHQITATDGDNSISVGAATIPASFPNDDVPLPAGASLKAAIAAGKSGHRAYTLSYSVPGGDVAQAAKDYRDALTHAGYRIEKSASAGAAAAVFSAYTALGEQWDVIVYSGGATGADALLALQVTPHDRSKDPVGSGDAGGATTG
jgi:hypothetical protein